MAWALNDRGDSGRLLLVEDDQRLRMATERVLRRAGWSVDSAPDGPSALDLARAGEHELMLLDLHLPKLDGIKVLEAVQDIRCPPAVVIMSGFLDLDLTRRALDGGAVDVLEKPVAMDRLFEVLDEAHRTWRVRTEPGMRVPEPSTVPEILGGSPLARMLREQVATVSGFGDLPVMVIGETGTGKELVARAVHRLSGGSGPMVSINCAAITEELFESELFGHEGGAFTGARGQRRGLLEEAADGTVFLDEVGELPPAQQAKLLRVLETRRFRRVGSNRELRLRARIISATNRPLRGAEGEPMRSDLFFRLAGFTIRTPRLRDRMEDLEPLADYFLAEFAARYSPSEVPSFSPRALDAFLTHDWPGNVRELRSMVMLAAVSASGASQVGVRHVADALRSRGCLDGPATPPSGTNPGITVHRPLPSDVLGTSPSGSPESLPSYEKECIVQAYRECNGNISKAARRVGIPRTTLRDKLKRYGLR